MKNLVKNIFLFLLFSLLIYLILLISWGEFAPRKLKGNLKYKIGSNGHLFTRLKELKAFPPEKKIDLLFLGSSHSYMGFDPRVFEKHGYSTFNLGSSAQSPVQTEILVKRYLKQLNPQTIIYEVCPSTVMGDGLESCLDLIANDKIDLEIVKSILKLNHVKAYNTVLYGFYRELFNKNNDFVEPQSKDNRQYIKGGFVESEISFFRNTFFENKSIIPLENKQFEKFERVAKMIKEQNFRLILVQSPVTKAYYNSLSNNKEFDAKLNSIGEYYNFNEFMQLDDSLHFLDTHHLNQIGVESFNKKLIEVVLEKQPQYNSLK